MTAAPVPEDVTALIERGKRYRGYATNLVGALTDGLERLVAELSDYMEVEQVNRDLVKRCDFWKARAEKAEAERDRWCDAAQDTSARLTEALHRAEKARAEALDEAALRIENDDPLFADHIRALKEQGQ